LKIVVTGGAGFVGSAVCRALAAEETVSQIVVLDDLSTGSVRNIKGIDRVRLVVGNILDHSTVLACLEGASSVVHLAARASVEASILDPYSMHEITATGTIRVLECCRQAGVPHFVMASTAAVYGPAPTLPTPEWSAPKPVSPYAASKLAAESYALAYANSFDLGVLPLRLFNVYGPRQALEHASGAVVPSFLDAALAGRPITILGDGTQTRDLIFVETVSGIITTAVANGSVSDHPINIGSGTGTSLLQLAHAIGDLLGQELVIEYASPRVSDVQHSMADIGTLQKMFANVRHLDLVTGLSKTVEWYRTESLKYVH